MKIKRDGYEQVTTARTHFTIFHDIHPPPKTQFIKVFKLKLRAELKKWMKNRWAFSSFVVKMREDARGSPFVWWQHRTHCRCLTFDSGETGECSGSSSLSAGKCPNLISFKSWIKSNLCVSRSFTAEVFVGMATCWVPICSPGDALQLWFWLRDRRCRSSGAKSGWTRDFRFFLWRSRTLTAG